MMDKYYNFCGSGFMRQIKNSIALYLETTENEECNGPEYEYCGLASEEREDGEWRGEFLCETLL
jgi:hypothetical protein